MACQNHLEMVIKTATEDILVSGRMLFNRDYFIKEFLIVFRDGKSDKIMEAEGFPVMVPTSQAFYAAGKKVDGPEQEDELGIFQVLERLEEVTSMLASRWQH